MVEAPTVHATRTDGPAPVIWLTGISGSGKSTLAARLDQILKRDRPVTVLDGDVVRAFFEDDLGYDRQDRIANVKRIAFAAKMLADQGVTVIVANIAPYAEVRAFVRARISAYIQIYLDASVSAVVQRDVKGLYARSGRERTPRVIGLDDTYEPPRHADLTIKTDATSVDESVARICALLRERGLLCL